MHRPNVIFILIDDMGWKDLGVYGSTFYETPNLDRLAAEGLRFTHAYAACPVCSPTRASAMTGKYPARVGITDWIDHAGQMHPCKGKLIDVPYLKELPLHERTIAQDLQSSGYRTWHVGKWHLGGGDHTPEHHGFDVNIGGCEWGAPKHGYFSPYKHPSLVDGPAGEYLTDRLTDEAIALIQSKDERPFFLNLCHYAVHTPLQAKPEDVVRFEQKAKQLGLDQMDPIEQGEHFPTEHKKHLRLTRRRLQSHPTYAAMVYNLDWNIGRLLAALEESGQADHTLIVFTSDNGGLATSEGAPTCNAPLSEGKGWMYEGGVRVPFLVRWPSVIPAGCECHEPIVTPDVFPTFRELAGQSAQPDYAIDGVSLLPLLSGPVDGVAPRLDREAIYWHYPHYGNQGGTPGSSMRMGTYKLIEFFEDGRLELYNLEDDASEQHNLAAVMPELASRMQRMLEDWRVSIEALIPQPNLG